MKRRHSHIKNGNLWTVIFGILLGAVSLCAFALIFALIAYMGSDPSALTGIFSIISLLLASCVMGIFVSRRVGEGGVAIAALCALIFAAIMLAVELIVKRGAVGAPFAINIASALGVCVIAAYLARKKRGSHHSRYMRH